MSHPLTKRLHKAGISGKSIARRLEINQSHVFNFLAGRRHKVGRAKRRMIRTYLIEIGILAKPKQRPRHACPECGKVHACSRKFTTRQLELK